ncbi:MAG: hypothetical protein GXX94_03370 [Chloroflexi bacterium]|nr:hypothetical protein [Chloroflexota bacterium]
MKEQDNRHWALLEIADREAPSHTIDLWPRIEARTASGASGRTRERDLRVRRGRLALGVTAALLCAVLLARVPGVRAFADDVIQRMGIAFLDTERHEDAAVQTAMETIRVTPPPSLSIAEIREQVSFPLLVPTWLPDDLTHTHRSIAEYDSEQWEGSGQKITIAYYRTAQHDFEGGGPVPVGERWAN